MEHDLARSGGGDLWLRICHREERLVLEVEHDGHMTAEDRAHIEAQLREEGEITGLVGIRNVSRRLKLIYGEAGSLTVDETEHGTILARISFPDTEEEK